MQGKPVLLFGRGYEFTRPFPLDMRERSFVSGWLYQITVIGAGLAGCEKAWQIAKRGGGWSSLR
jgi:hypothetical protein